jgi:hypothetical protein
MYQGTQRKFMTSSGSTCNGRVAAQLSADGFCFLAADDSLKCAGVAGNQNFGTLFSSAHSLGVAVQNIEQLLFLNNVATNANSAVGSLARCCTFGPRFAPGKVLQLALSSYSDSMCAIYNDGSVWCIGSNTNGKFGIGNALPLNVETLVAPAGGAHIGCD